MEATRADRITKQVAVVVPTHNRRDLLLRSLDALAATELDPDAVEVIVVDDGSTDGTPAALDGLERTFPLQLHCFRLDSPRGPAVARNVGWRAASAPLVAFTDDDCAPEPSWLAALTRAVYAGADFVQGRTIADPHEARGPFSHTMVVTAASGRFETCNMAYRRELLESLGGFDESFRYPYGEDTDLGVRAAEAGATFAFAADAVVRHAVTPSSPVDRLRTAPRLEGVVLAVRRHPSLRQQMTAGVFTKPHHPHVLASAAGLALLAASGTSGTSRRRLAVALLLQLPFLWYRTFVEQLPARKWTWPVVLPVALVLDVVNMSVLARASVKHRTLVL